MTRAQELADMFEAALAAHVPASQTAEWEGWEAYLGLVALAEAGERAREALREVVNFPFDVMSNDGTDLRSIKSIARAALGEGQG